MTVRVQGLNQTVRALQRFGAEVDDLKDVFGEIATLGADLASSFAPVRTGRLAATVRGNRAKNKAVVAAGRARVPYAGVINYGWPLKEGPLMEGEVRARRPGPIAASLFMQRADEVLAPRAVTMLEDGLNRLIERTDLQ